MNNVSRSIISNEIKANTMPVNLLHKIIREGALPISFYEISIILILKTYENTAKRKL
jgi:hypothetical protein